MTEEHASEVPGCSSQVAPPGKDEACDSGGCGSMAIAHGDDWRGDDMLGMVNKLETSVIEDDDSTYILQLSASLGCDLLKQTLF